MRRLSFELTDVHVGLHCQCRHFSCVTRQNWTEECPSQPDVVCQLASWIYTRVIREKKLAQSFGVWHWWPSAMIRFGYLYKYCSLSLSPFLSLDKMLFTFSLSSPLKLGLKMQTVLMSHAFLSYTGCIQKISGTFCELSHFWRVSVYIWFILPR